MPHAVRATAHRGVRAGAGVDAHRALRPFRLCPQPTLMQRRAWPLRFDV